MGNKPVILYTRIVGLKQAPRYQVQNYVILVNYLDPFLREWIKCDDNQIVKPTNENMSSFYDQTTTLVQQWSFENDRRNKQSGIPYMYRSRDIVKWTKVKHTLHDKQNIVMWECLDFSNVSSRGRYGETSAGGIRHVFKLILDLTRFEYHDWYI